MIAKGLPEALVVPPDDLRVTAASPTAVAARETIDSAPPGRAVMRDRASVHKSIRRAVDITPIAQDASRAVVPSHDGRLHPIPLLAAEPRAIDASLYMFALCSYLQTTCLARGGIRYVLDADGVGRLPGPVCRMLGLMVCELAHDASACTQPETARETVTVTLRRRGTICLCTISRRCLADTCACPQAGLQRALKLSAELGDKCMIRSIPERGITAVMFDINLVAPCIPAALWRYRAGEASHRAERLTSAVLA